MKKREEVSQFLQDFIAKSKIWDIIFRTDRINNKNALTLLDLEISYTDAKKILLELVCEDYAAGPLPDNLYNLSDMWVFGKVIKGKEVYIKVQLGRPNSATICISFHYSEHKMVYPFKISRI
ncbi:MAG TPA: hypothetical protein VHD83_18535 [Puia sp.]|nr:hypothetical protein [Puia sp.]